MHVDMNISRTASATQDKRGLECSKDLLLEMKMRLAGQVQSLEAMEQRLYGVSPPAAGNTKAHPTGSGVFGEINEVIAEIGELLEKGFNSISKISQTI